MANPSTSATKETAPEPEEKVSEPVAEKAKFVVHHPHQGFSSRVITKADWASIGIESEDVEWDASNRFRLPVAKFSPEALEYLTKVDDGFSIE